VPHYASGASLYPGFCITIRITGQHSSTWRRLFYAQFMITVDQMLLPVISDFVITVLVVLYRHNRTM
jgi:hypothetical protein